jgi:hypothetical protein
MARKNDTSGPHGRRPANTGGKARADGGFGLEALAKMLSEASINMSLLAMDGAREAANDSSPLAAADSARRVGDQISTQMKSLEAALREVMAQPQN